MPIPGELRGTSKPELAAYMFVGLQSRSHAMSRISAVVLSLLLGSLIVSLQALAQGVALAQLTPPAGSAGAGNSPISGVPFGPANPSVLSDPSGIGNASRLPPLGTNTPAAPIAAPAIAPPRPTTTPVVGASQRLSIPDRADRRRKPHRPRGRAEVSKFTGICRGC